MTDSASKGHPDAEVIGVDSRLETTQQILNVTDKPMIIDGDTGGDALNFEYMCSKLETMGVSAVVIEDKQYPKRNSLEPGTTQVLENPGTILFLNLLSKLKILRIQVQCIQDDNYGDSIYLCTDAAKLIM